MLGLTSAALLLASFRWAHPWGPLSGAIVASWGLATIAALVVSVWSLRTSRSSRRFAVVGLALTLVSLIALTLAGVLYAAGGDVSGGMRQGVALGLIVLAAAAGWIALRDWRRGYESTRGATVRRFTVHSALVGRDLHEILVIPAGDRRRRPLLVFLHGRSSSPDSNLRQPLFDALRDLGPRAPVVLLADGGDHSYWHDRRDGKWGTSLLREAIPAALSRSHADDARVAIGGISMGGFGALDLARLAPRRFCAVGAHSAALWFRGAARPPGHSTTQRTSLATTSFALHRPGRSTPEGSGSM